MKKNICFFSFIIMLLMNVCILKNTAMSQNVIPLKNITTGKYYFTFSNIYFEVNPDTGARISSFKLSGHEVLYVNNSQINWGSTFWPSPQSVWNWPPIAAIDNSAYTAVIKGNKIIMVGNVDNTYKLSVTKIFTANSADTSISINYILKNTGTSAQSWAPWEVTRVPANGMIFFKQGNNTPSGPMAGNTALNNGYVWYDQDHTSSSNSVTKFLCDGKGMIACVNDSKQLIIKSFQDIPVSAFAPGEAEIEAYTAPDHSYTELEVQGSYISIPAKTSLSWTVKWFLRNLPANDSTSVGSQELINYVNSFCTNSLPMIDSLPCNIKLSISKTDATCNGCNDGTAIATPSGGTTPYSILWSNGDTVQTIINLLAKKYSITVIDADACSTTDSVTINQFGKPHLDKIDPAIGGNTGDLTATIYGAGFIAGTSVKLTRTGYPDIVAPDTLINIFNGQRINATFNLRNQVTGFWNVVVTIPGDTVMTLVNGFGIQTGDSAQVWSNLIGSNVIRLNQWQNYTVVIGNNGNVDATVVPVWISVPQKAQVKFSFPITNPYGNKYDYDTIQNYFPTDSVWLSPSNSKMYCFAIAKVPPEQTRQLNFMIKINTPGCFQIQSWINKPLYNNSTLDTKQSECFHDLFENLIVGQTPPMVQCLYSAQDAIVKIWKDSPWGDKIFGQGTSNPSYGSIEYILDYSRTLGSMILTCLGSIVDLPYVIDVVQHINDFTDLYNSCSTTLYPSYQIARNNINIIASFDPNEKIGPEGAGSAHYNNDKNAFPYAIHFENADSATAFVQSIQIVDSLDKKVFNLNTLQLGFISFGDTLINIPNGSNTFSTDIDLRPKNNNLIVHINAALNDTTGVLIWKFTSLDPSNLQPTTNPLAGFLPPNINAPEGEGGVFYSIKVKDSIPNNSSIKNKAYIFFDNNSPVPTNNWTNTIDNIKPHSKVNTLPSFVNDTSFTVSWSGVDTSSGVKDYSIYFSVNGGAYKSWKLHTTVTSAIFIGQVDSTYSFYSIALDSAGNIETAPLVANAITRITSIKNVNSANNFDLRIYPNPTNNKFTIQIGNQNVFNNLKILNTVGQVVLNKKITDKVEQVDLSGQPAGVYFIKLQSANNAIMKKIILQR